MAYLMIINPTETGQGEIDGLIGLLHLFRCKAHSYQTMAKYDCPGALCVDVKGKHGSSPAAWVLCIGQICDHNLW